MNRKIGFLVAGLIIALVAGIAIAAAVYTLTSNTLTFPVKPANTVAPTLTPTPSPQVTLTLEGREYYPPPVQYVFERDGVLQNEPLLFIATLSDKMEGVSVKVTLTKVGDTSQIYTQSSATNSQGQATIVVPANTLSVGNWQAAATAEHP